MTGEIETTETEVELAAEIQTIAKGDDFSFDPLSPGLASGEMPDGTKVSLESCNMRDETEILVEFRHQDEQWERQRVFISGNEIIAAAANALIESGDLPESVFEEE